LSTTTTKSAKLGSVTWPDDGPVATLFDDGTWSVPAMKWMESALKLAYSDAYEGPQDGPFGPSILAQLAVSVGGVAHIEPRDEPAGDGEVIY
jgi:hypothetical protein